MIVVGMKIDLVFQKHSKNSVKGIYLLCPASVGLYVNMETSEVFPSKAVLPVDS